MVLALCFTAALASDSLGRAVSVALLGIVFGLVGNDIASGTARFTFGLPGLVEGLDFVVVAVGLFAVAEVVAVLNEPEERRGKLEKIRGWALTLADFRAAWAPVLRGSAVGTFFGILPGVGAAISSFAAYML